MIRSKERYRDIDTVLKKGETNHTKLYYQQTFNSLYDIRYHFTSMYRHTLLRPSIVHQ